MTETTEELGPHKKAGITLADPAAQAIINTYATANAIIVQCCTAFRKGQIGTARDLHRQARDMLGEAGNLLAVYAPPDEELAGMGLGELRSEIDQIDTKTEYLLTQLDPGLHRSGPLAAQFTALEQRRERLANELKRRRSARKERTKQDA